MDKETVICGVKWRMLICVVKTVLICVKLLVKILHKLLFKQWEGLTMLGKLLLRLVALVDLLLVQVNSRIRLLNWVSCKQVLLLILKSNFWLENCTWCAKCWRMKEELMILLAPSWLIWFMELMETIRLTDLFKKISSLMIGVLLSSTWIDKLI